MTRYAVYQVEFGGDVDGTGPERWLGALLGSFDTEDQALDFMDAQNEVCEVIVETRPL